MTTLGPRRTDWWRAAAGHAFYSPDLYYFFEIDQRGQRPKDFPFARAAHVVARCVAPWADRYWAVATWRRDPQRQGRLPDDPEAREAVIDNLFHWFAVEQPNDLSAALTLHDGERWVMDAHDGFPGPLQLTPEQFAMVQEHLLEADLPRDLYFPLLEQREVVEPAESNGGIVRQLHVYSPQEWAHRDAAAIAARRVPTEDERRRAFDRAYDAFKRALMLRLGELREPGARPEAEEVRDLEDLFVQVMYNWQVNALRLRGQEERVAQWRATARHAPTAGWRRTPTAFEALESALPALRRLHADGHVRTLVSGGSGSDGLVYRWTLWLYVPADDRDQIYDLVDGVLVGPGRTHEPHWREAATILDVRQGGRPALLDSDDARRVADAAGGGAFNERCGKRSAGMRLRGDAEGGFTWEVFYNQEYDTPGHFWVTLDARTGDVLVIDEGPPPPPVMPPD